MVESKDASIELAPITIYTNCNTLFEFRETQFRLEDFIEIYSQNFFSPRDYQRYFATCHDAILRTYGFLKNDRKKIIKNIFGIDYSEIGKAQYQILGIPQRINAMNEFKTKLISNSLPFQLEHVGSSDERYILSSLSSYKQ